MSASCVLTQIDQLSRRGIPTIYAATDVDAEPRVRPWLLLLRIECELADIERVTVARSVRRLAREYRGRAELVRCRLGFEAGIVEPMPDEHVQLVSEIVRRLKGG